MTGVERVQSARVQGGAQLARGRWRRHQRSTRRHARELCPNAPSAACAQRSQIGRAPGLSPALCASAHASATAACASWREGGQPGSGLLLRLPLPRSRRGVAGGAASSNKASTILASTCGRVATHVRLRPGKD